MVIDMQRLVLLLCGMIAGLSAAQVEQPRAQLLDRAIRYVNEDIITLGDLVERLQSQRKRNAPTNVDEELAMWREQLEELTVDELLIQFAVSKGVSINADQINQQVTEEAKRSGRGMNLVDLARARQRVEKREKVGAALGFFDQRAASVSPSELLDAYAQRKDALKRPARAHVLQIVLRPSDPAERLALHDDQARIFRQAQDVDPASAAVVAPLFDRLVALDAESPERAALLDDAVAQLATVPIDQASAALRDLVATAAKLVQRRAAMRSRDDVQATMTDLRAELDGKGVDAFKAACKGLSQGPRADEGGELGWIEPGFFTKEIDTVIFALEAGQLSQPVWSQHNCCLTLVAERTEASQRSFAEVVGELESLLRQERQRAIRITAAAVLRQRAVIRDLAPLEELMRGG